MTECDYKKIIERLEKKVDVLLQDKKPKRKVKSVKTVRYSFRGIKEKYEELVTLRRKYIKNFTIVEKDIDGLSFDVYFCINGLKNLSFPSFAIRMSNLKNVSGCSILDDYIFLIKRHGYTHFNLFENHMPKSMPFLQNIALKLQSKEYFKKIINDLNKIKALNLEVNKILKQNVNRNIYYDSLIPSKTFEDFKKKCVDCIKSTESYSVNKNEVELVFEEIK